MSDDGKTGSFEDIAEMVGTYGAGYQTETDGLSSSHRPVFNVTQDDLPPQLAGAMASVVRPDLDDFLNGLRGKFARFAALSEPEQRAFAAKLTPFSQESYELRMIACSDTFAKLNGSEGSQTDPNALGIAFVCGLELGGLVKEYEWKFEHEKAALEGHRHMEGRAAGQPMGAQANRNIGNKHRRAVIAAAKRLIAENRAFARNLSELARVIESEKLTALRRKDGSYLGDSSIRSHLKAARKSGEID